jgi:streptogramin lyase
VSAGPGAAYVALQGRPALARVAAGHVTLVPLPGPADAVAQSGDVVWVATGGSVLRLDAATGRALGPARQVARRAAALAVTPRAVWILDAARAALLRLDPHTGREVGAPVPVAARPTGMAADSREVWVISASSHVATRIDARTGRILDEVGVAAAPSSVALSPRYAWVTGARGTVTRVPRA